MKNISKIAGIFVALVLSVAFIACANNAAPSENNTSNVSQGNTSSDPLAGYTYTNNAWGMSCTFESGGNIKRISFTRVTGFRPDSSTT